jgi:hypothetical protein
MPPATVNLGQKKLRITFRLFTTFGRHHKETRRVSCRPNVPQ